MSGDAYVPYQGTAFRIGRSGEPPQAPHSGQNTRIASIPTQAPGGRKQGGSLGDALDGVGLFDGLDKQLRHRLITAARPRNYHGGELLYTQGEAGSDLLLLMSGSVVLFRAGAAGARPHRATLAVIQPPGVLGEEALAGGLPRMFSAEAVHASFALALPESELVGVMQQAPVLGEMARRWLGAQMGKLAEQRGDDVLLDLPGRVAKTLLELADRGTRPPTVDVSQRLLAMLARGSRQNVNLALKQFAERGWLRLERSKVAIIDAAALARRASD